MKNAALIIAVLFCASAARSQSMDPDAQDQPLEAMTFDAAANTIGIQTKGAQPTTHPQDEICMQVEPGVVGPLFGRRRDDRRRRVAKFHSVAELVATFAKTPVMQVAPSSSVEGLVVESVVFERSLDKDVYSMFLINLVVKSESVEVSQDLVCIKLDSRVPKPMYMKGRFRDFLVFPSVESLAQITERDIAAR